MIQILIKVKHCLIKGQTLREKQKEYAPVIYLQKKESLGKRDVVNLITL